MDPELRPAFEQIPAPKRYVFDPEEIRAGAQARLARFNELAGGPHPEVERTDRADAPVPVRVYEPLARGDGELLPAILFVHGGGFVANGTSSWDYAGDRHARTVPAVVVSPEYRVAPENPFPAPLEDCYATLLWIAQAAGELGVDPDRIAVVGESSGGGIAAGLALLARDRGDVRLAFQMPLRAALDDRHDTRSSREIVDLRTWSRERSLAAWGAYLGREPGGSGTPAYAAPARADDLSGLPPAYLAVGQLDVVLDENVDYARRLMEAGVPTELHVYAGAIHNFENLSPNARISTDSLLDQKHALIRALHRPR